MLIYSPKIDWYFLNLGNKEYYSFRNEDKFKKYFYSFICEEFLDKLNFTVYGIQDDPVNIDKNDLVLSKNNDNIERKNINIMHSVENCSYWYYYIHYDKYGDYNDELISIYIYNHIDKFIKTDKYIAIPVIYLQIDYFNKYFNTIKPSIFTPFNKKKFCLVCSNSRNKYNNNLDIALNKLKMIGNCDYIKDISILNDKSCYHDETLLNVFNQYKFIYCFENSLTDGYITEKIFNCFFSRTIPIYFGPNDKYRYFNNNSFINIETFSDDTLDYIKYLNENENIFNDFLNNDIINKNFYSQNYLDQSHMFIYKFI
jgi:hypothetical protein